MTLVKKIIFLCIFLIGSIIVPVVSVSAFSDRLPDPDDITPGSSVWLMSQESIYVQESNARLAIWFPSNSGRLTIIDPNYCTGNTGEYNETGYVPSNGTRITEFEVNGTSYYGRTYTNASNCGDSTNITIDFNNLPASSRPAGTDFYQVNINVRYMLNGRPGLNNAYKLNGSAGSYTGVRASSTDILSSSGHGVTMEQTDTTPSNITYEAFFGTRCNATANETARLRFFDLDNGGGSGAQRNGKVTIALRDRTTDTWVDLNGSASGYAWEPDDLNNVAQSRDFTARPNHKYKLEIRNVYWNNTIQYSLPYSQINSRPCAPTVSPSVTSPTSVNRGSNADFTLRRTVTNFSAPNRQVPYSVAYRYNNAGSWYNIPNANPIATGSRVYNNPSPLTISGNVTNAAFTPVLRFNTSQIPASARQICVRLTFADRVGYRVVNSPATRCMTVVTPGGGYDVDVTTPSHEKGSGDKTVTYRLTAGTAPCNRTDTIVWVTNGTTRTTSVPSNCGATNVTLATFTSPVAGSTLDGSPVGVYATYRASISTINGTAPASPIENEGDIVVFETPFVRFFGNDITTCSPNTDNSFLFDNRSGAQPANAAPINSNKGAYSFYATLYTNAEASGLNLNGLHTIADARDNLASSFSGTGCSASSVVIEYRGDQVQPTPTGDINIASLADDTFIERTDAFTVNGGDIGNDKITIKTTGDVVIDGNITSNIVTGALDVDTAPALLIVTDANIYITNNTNRVDAVLIAGGDIFTCSIGDNPVSRADWHLAPGSGGCANSLIVNGALNANTVHFMRSIGTRYLSNTSTTAPSNGAWQGNGIDQPAEIINFPSYLNFTPTYTKDFSTQGYDSYVQLPPRL
jgi:hypothetical protein